jgi:hypothetical protein
MIQSIKQQFLLFLCLNLKNYKVPATIKRKQYRPVFKDINNCLCYTEISDNHQTAAIPNLTSDNKLLRYYSWTAPFFLHITPKVFLFLLKRNILKRINKQF